MYIYHIIVKKGASFFFDDMVLRKLIRLFRNSYVFVRVCIFPTTLILVENMLLKVFARTKWLFSEKFIYLHRNYDVSFEIMSVSRKLNYLLRKYDLFFHKYALFKVAYLFSQKYGNFEVPRTPEHPWRSPVLGCADEFSRKPGEPLGPIY